LAGIYGMLSQHVEDCSHTLPLRRDHRMTTTVSLITPTYHRDFESCRLLCDSIDTFVVGFDKHYLLVSDDDYALFSPLNTDKRSVVPESKILFNALRPLPRFMNWKGRQYYWAPGAGLPVYGWHVQQFRKLAMAVYQPSERVICIDSDNCFVQPFDAGEAAGGEKSPLYADIGCVNQTRPHHVVWQKNAYRLLGEQEPPLPGDDYVGQMIVWDRQSVQSILERIEAVTGIAWWKALCKVRSFSEYILYGIGVKTDPDLFNRHKAVSQSMCNTYWSGPALDEAGIRALIAQMTEGQSAISIQSHTQTAPSLMRSVTLAKRA